MQQLHPFDPIDEVSLSGDIHFEQNQFNVSFCIERGLSEINLMGAPALFTTYPNKDNSCSKNSSLDGLSQEVPQRGHLWEKTCFEVFLRPKNEQRYFELNFAFLPGLGPSWACYEFTGYRTPNPPVFSSGFVLNRLSWDPRGTLLVELLNQTSHQKFDIGLTAVVFLKNGQKAYFALKHLGEKPDFHLAQSFVLERN